MSSRIVLPRSGRETARRITEGLSKGSFLRVVNFHNTVASGSDELDRAFAAAARRFASCSERDVLSFYETGRWPKERPGLIPVLFEGYRNNYEVALPLLEAHGFVAWFLLPSAFLSVPAAEQRSFARAHHIGLVDEDGDRVAMTWDEVRDADARGHVIASHTRHHVALDRSTHDAVLEDEIVGSQREFERNLGHRVRTFAWLFGSEYGTDPRADRYVRQAGYELLFSNFMLQRIRPQTHAPTRP